MEVREGWRQKENIEYSSISNTFYFEAFTDVNMDTRSSIRTDNALTEVQSAPPIMLYQRLIKIRSTNVNSNICVLVAKINKFS